jgi:hypothetical protein
MRKRLENNIPDTAATYDSIAEVYRKQQKKKRWITIGILLGLVPLIGGFVTGHWFIGIVTGIVTAFVGAFVFPGVRRWRLLLKYDNIAGVYAKQGDYPQALEWHYKALAIRLFMFGDADPDIAMTYNNIAGVYAKQGDYPQALEWYQKALTVYERLAQNIPGEKLEASAILEKALGKKISETAVTCDGIAAVYAKHGDYPRALKLRKEALAIREKVREEEQYDSIQRKNCRWISIGVLFGLVPLIGGFVTGHWFIGIVTGIATAFVGAFVLTTRGWGILAMTLICGGIALGIHLGHPFILGIIGFIAGLVIWVVGANKLAKANNKGENKIETHNSYTGRH